MSAINEVKKMCSELKAGITKNDGFDRGLVWACEFIEDLIRREEMKQDERAEAWEKGWRARNNWTGVGAVVNPYKREV